MRQSTKVLIPGLAASLALAACGSSSSSKNTTAATQSQPTASQPSASASSSALVKTASSKLGTVLVDAQGMTLYRLSGEQSGKFICTSTACLQVWHPLTVPAGSAPSGTVGSLATVKRPDGREQITFKGQPLYTFAQDQAPGQTNGEGIKDVGTWMAVSAAASGAATPSTTSATTPSSPSSSEGSSKSGRYGY
jgi:predicted lipoprotein with Yx(FWY)xxD motif